MSLCKKTLIAAICVAFLFSFSVASAEEQPATGDDSAQIQALLDQIQSLLAVIAQLQAQLVALSKNPNTPNVGFTKDFTIGDDDFQVQGLQKILNQDPKTRIASSGPGSPGQETTYYGALTAAAVAKFQELYASEILTPNGLTKGSGYFGPSTRAKMNAIVREKTAETAANTPGFNEMVENADDTASSGQTTSGGGESLDLSMLSGGNSSGSTGGSNSVNFGSLASNLNYEVSDEFSVGHASSYAGAPGEHITIDGIKLTNATVIHFDGTDITGNASADGTTLTFTVPDIKKGPYELTFTSESGEKAIRIMDFVITDVNATAPEIYSISPAIGPNGSTITIYGSGFTPTDNQVEFGLNAVNGIPSSDGKSLVVTVTPGLDLSPQNKGEWPVFIYVANANGRVEKPSIFVIKQ